MAEPYAYVGGPRLLDGYRVRAQSWQGSLRAYLAEGTGSFVLTLVCGGSWCVEAVFGGLGVTGVALSQGLALVALGLIFGHVSGGQFNPALTVAMVVVRRQAPLHGLGYVLAQLAGAAAAGGALLLLFGRYDLAAAPPFLGAPRLAPELTPLEGMGIEALLTFLWVSSVFATQIDPRGKRAFAPVAAGIALLLAVLWGGQLTGAAVNPARAFGTALGAQLWTAHHAFWIGPLLGGLAAAGFYELLLGGRPFPGSAELPGAEPS
ncbi:MAG: aquaporin [Elusimicrobia bacterium]|nr:aquaporin [Elusimicrobiota bacterium]